MKCISLYQPWATLVAVGAKKIETRSWATTYRGPLAIHAGRTWTKELFDLSRRPPFRDVLESGDGILRLVAGSAAYHWRDWLPLGKIVAVVDLVDCRHISEHNAPPNPEMGFGDYTPGRWMWKLENVRRLEKPVPIRGRQRIFNISDRLVA